MPRNWVPPKDDVLRCKVHYLGMHPVIGQNMISWTLMWRKAWASVGVAFSFWWSLSCSKAYSCLFLRFQCGSFPNWLGDFTTRSLCTYLQTWFANQQAPKRLYSMALKFSNMVIPWARNGNMWLGFPLGTSCSVMNQTEKIEHLILSELPNCAQIYDEIFRVQRFWSSCQCMLLCFSHGASHDRTLLQAVAVDRVVWRIFRKPA